jgi:YesN/AraC family two-component response regulator
MSRKKILVITEDPREYAPAFADLPHFLQEVHHTSFASCESITGIPHYDIILLDCCLNIPKGLRILETIKKVSPQTSVLFVCDGGPCDTVIRAFRLGARDYMLKPIDCVELRNTIETLYHFQRRSLEKRSPFLPPYKAGLSELEPSQTLPLQDVLKFIENDLTADLSLEALARLAGLSKYHFIRRFRKRTGFTPKEYIITKRIERAKALMKKGGMSISEISSEVGFNHVSNFSKLFRKFTGHPPIKFKKEFQRKAPIHRKKRSQ